MTPFARVLGLCAIAPALAACSHDDVALDAKVQVEVNRAVSSPSAEIEVAVSDGVVTLSGTVPNAVDRVRAEEAANKVDGVKEVKDNLGIGDQSDRSVSRPPPPR